MSLENDGFNPGTAAVLLGGQWGSEGKGAAAAWWALQMYRTGNVPNLITTNAGAQAGHTTIHNDRVYVCFHIPSAALILKEPAIYLNQGCVIDIDVLLKEVGENGINPARVTIHPFATVITDEDKAAEADPSSNQTKIASTRKGIGAALSNRVLRRGKMAIEFPLLKDRFNVERLNLNDVLTGRKVHGPLGRVLVEIPQGLHLSLGHSPFYPYTTSRNCTVGQGLADADIHPRFAGPVMLVVRTFPIRVGSIYDPDGNQIGYSGDHFPDQQETSWEELGQVPEVTTVTKRVRRVFTFSKQQLIWSLRSARPDILMITFCNYWSSRDELRRFDRTLYSACDAARVPYPKVVYQWGPTTDDAGTREDLIETMGW